MRENKRYELEVHVAPICFRRNNGGLQVLIAKRAPTRKLYPSKWECSGGQVHPGENFYDAAIRQAKEELGVDIKIIAPQSCYEISTDHLPQKKIPGIRFVCKVTRGDPTLNSQEHIEWKWLPLTQLADIDFLSNLAIVIPEAAKLFT